MVFLETAAYVRTPTGADVSEWVVSVSAIVANGLVAPAVMSVLRSAVAVADRPAQRQISIVSTSVMDEGTVHAKFTVAMK